MKRRELLQLSCASAAVLVLPLPAIPETTVLDVWPPPPALANWDAYFAACVRRIAESLAIPVEMLTREYSDHEYRPARSAAGLADLPADRVGKLGETSCCLIQAPCLRGNS